MEEEKSNSIFVTVSLEKYEELIRARMAIDTIGASENKYGFDSDVVRAVLQTFGYVHKEDSDAE